MGNCSTLDSCYSGTYGSSCSWKLLERFIKHFKTNQTFMETSSAITAGLALVAFCILFWYSRRWTKRLHRHEEHEHSCGHIDQVTLHTPLSTGYTYPCSDGQRRNVWVSPLGKFYVIRTSSATDKNYNQYIHDEHEGAFREMFKHDYPQHSYIFN